MCPTSWTIKLDDDAKATVNTLSLQQVQPAPFLRTREVRLHLARGDAGLRRSSLQTIRHRNWARGRRSRRKHCERESLELRTERMFQVTQAGVNVLQGVCVHHIASFHVKGSP